LTAPEKYQVCFKENIMSTTGMTQLPCNEFVNILAGKDPVPGGGGASALTGAIGTALGNMVGSLTLGKKKYADVESDILALNNGAKAIEAHLLNWWKRMRKFLLPLQRPTEIRKKKKPWKSAFWMPPWCHWKS
jgi:hypothetical protein